MPGLSNAAAAALLVTGDESLVSEVLRVAAGAGVTVDVHHDPAAALVRWSQASVVLVGTDLARSVVVISPPRRDAVHVVGAGPLPADSYQNAVTIGATSVTELAHAPGWLPELLSDIGDDRGRPVLTVAVVGGSGGAGATVLAAALAFTAGRSGRTVLIDLDPLGPGQRRILGLEHVGGLTWRDLADTHGRLGSRSLREALPTRSGVGVLSWPEEPMEPLSADVVRAVVEAGQRGHEWVVLDVPRTAGLAAGVLAGADHIVLIARADVASVASTARVLASLRDRVEARGSLGLVVRRNRGSVSAAEVGSALGVPVLAEVRHQRRLDEHLDLGLGPVHHRRGPLARAASRLVADLAAP